MFHGCQGALLCRSSSFFFHIQNKECIADVCHRCEWDSLDLYVGKLFIEKREYSEFSHYFILKVKSVFMRLLVHVLLLPSTGQTCVRQYYVTISHKETNNIVQYFSMLYMLIYIMCYLSVVIFFCTLLNSF